MLGWWSGRVGGFSSGVGPGREDCCRTFHLAGTEGAWNQKATAKVPPRSIEHMKLRLLNSRSHCAWSVCQAKHSKVDPMIHYNMGP